METRPVTLCAALGLSLTRFSVFLAVLLSLLFPHTARPAAITALQTIDYKGNNFTTDSFDSADPAYSTNGLYPSGRLDMTKANGDMVTDGTITNSFVVGNANIKGHVATGPNGNVSIGAYGSVGERTWVEGGNRGIEPGWYANGMNLHFTDLTLPANAQAWLRAVHTAFKFNGVL